MEFELFKMFESFEMKMRSCHAVGVYDMMTKQCTLYFQENLLSYGEPQPYVTTAAEKPQTHKLRQNPCFRSEVLPETSAQ